MATPRVAAGALLVDGRGHVLLVKPTYKQHWDIPGGYVEPGESPRAACIREIQEELGLTLHVASILTVDWAPASDEGDKILFVFDAGKLSEDQERSIAVDDDEISDWRYVAAELLDEYAPARLVRRIRTALTARTVGRPIYAEHGSQPD